MFDLDLTASQKTENKFPVFKIEEFIYYQNLKKRKLTYVRK